MNKLHPQYKGKIGAQPVMTVQQIKKLAEQRRALVCKSGMFSHRPQPAACILNLTGYQILALIGRGLFVYHKPTKNK